MRFEVRALSPELTVSLLAIDGRDEADARRQVEARGLFVAAIAPTRGGLLGLSGLFGARAGGRRALPLVLFSQELLALLTAGLGIVEALDALLEKEASQARRGALERLLAGLREGRRFSAVLAEQPDLFPPLYIGIVEAAEGSSDLPRALSRYIAYQQRIDLVRNRLVSAAIYPAILLLVGGAVSAFLITYVVPRFAELYQGAGRTLPWLSRTMLAWGRFAGAHSLFLLCAAVSLLLLLVALARRVAASGGLPVILARLPGIGARARIYELSRLYLTLGMLAEGGIPVVQAIATVQGVVSAPLRLALRAARAAVEAGQPLSAAFEANGLSTPIALRMLRVGERSGDMGAMLTQSAVFYDGEIGRAIERFTRSVEPLLMAAIGLVVGAIVVLLYLPIFDLAGDFS